MRAYVNVRIYAQRGKGAIGAHKLYTLHRGKGWSWPFYDRPLLFLIPIASGPIDKPTAASQKKKMKKFSHDSSIHAPPLAISDYKVETIRCDPISTTRIKYNMYSSLTVKMSCSNQSISSVASVTRDHVAHNASGPRNI